MDNKIAIVPNSLNWADSGGGKTWSLCVKVKGLRAGLEQYKKENDWVDVDIGAAKTVLLLSRIGVKTSFCCDGIFAHHRFTLEFACFKDSLTPYISCDSEPFPNYVKKIFKRAAWEDTRIGSAFYMLDGNRKAFNDNSIRKRWRDLNNGLSEYIYNNCEA